MKNRIVLMINTVNPGHQWASVGVNKLTLLGIALALAGCGKPAAKPPEKSLVRTAVVEPMGNVRSDGEASYLASGEVRPRNGPELQSGRDRGRHRPGRRHGLGRRDAGEGRDGAGRVEAGGFHKRVELGAREGGIGGQDSGAFSQTARDGRDFPAGTRCDRSGLAHGAGRNWIRRSRIFAIRGWWRPRMEWCWRAISIRASRFRPASACCALRIRA